MVPEPTATISSKLPLASGVKHSALPAFVGNDLVELLQSLTDPVIILSDDGRLLYANANGLLLFELASERHDFADVLLSAEQGATVECASGKRVVAKIIQSTDSKVFVLHETQTASSGTAESIAKEFRRMMDSIGIAYILFDRDLNIEYFSKAAGAAAPLEGSIGHQLSEFIEVRPEMIEFYKRALASKKTLSISDYTPVDSRVPSSLNITAVPLADQLAVFYENNENARERVDALTRSNERFRRLSDSLSVALVIVDQLLNVTYWNSKAEGLTGLVKEKVVGQSAKTIFPLISDELSEMFVHALEAHQPFEVNGLHYRDKNVSGFFGIRAFPVGDELAILIEDKTEQERAAGNLRMSEERFRTVSQNMSLAFTLIDGAGKVCYWNKMCEVTSGGITASQVLGKDAATALPLREETLQKLLAGARSSVDGIRLRILPERENVSGVYDIRAFAVGEEVGVIIEDVTLQVNQAAELDRTNHQLLDLYQNAPCGYLSVWPNGEIEQINLRMTRWLGYKAPEEIVRKNVSEILSQPSRDTLQEQLQHAGLEGPLSNLELEFVQLDGANFWGLVNALPIFDPIKKSWYWRWTVIDITELRYAQTQIEDNRLFTQLFNELGEAVLISDKTGKIVRANKAAARILDMPIEQLTSFTHDSPVWQAVLDDGTPVPTSELPAVRALREKKPISNLEIGVVTPSGKLRWILESAAPLYDDAGEVTGVIVTFPEVSATVTQRQSLKDLNEKYQIERDRANEANRLKSSFLANMSHEIRTPMTAILGFSDILSTELTGKVSEQHHTFLRSINVSGKRLLNLINDILDLSKIEAGRLELQSEDIDVAAEIEASITPLAWIAQQKGLEVYVQSNPERLVMRGDRQRFGQVLTNIAGNAIKFTRSGSITVRTKIVPQANGRAVAVEIEDTGIGISMEFLPYLFEEFRQEHTGVTKEFGGTGLGLAISRRLVSLMGGQIHVRSEQGKGTVFTLQFPLSSTSSAPIALSPAAVIAPSNPQASAAPKVGRRHVLVVEDNPETQRLLEVYLKSEYRVSQAINAVEAVKVFKSDTPDIILMDVNLPGKDGLTITREIRQGSLKPNIPIIALTAFAMAGDRQRCLAAGCNDYLSKPATKREVLDIIAKTFAIVD